MLRATVGISVFPTPDTDAHTVAAGSRRPVAACEDGGRRPGVVKLVLAYAKIKGKPDISKF